MWPKYTPDVHIGDHLFEPGQFFAKTHNNA